MQWPVNQQKRKYGKPIQSTRVNRLEAGPLPCSLTYSFRLEQVVLLLDSRSALLPFYIDNEGVILSASGSSNTCQCAIKFTFNHPFFFTRALPGVFGYIFQEGNLLQSQDWGLDSEANKEWVVLLVSGSSDMSQCMLKSPNNSLAVSARSWAWIFGNSLMGHNLPRRQIDQSARRVICSCPVIKIVSNCLLPDIIILHIRLPICDSHGMSYSCTSSSLV